MLKNLYEKRNEIAKDTIIYYSKSYNYFQIFGGLFWIGAGLFVLLLDVTKFYKVVIILILLYISYALYTNIKSYQTKSKIKLIINDKGIMIEKRFLSWSKIQSFEFISKPDYSTTIPKVYLLIHTTYGEEEIFINELDITSEKLNFLMGIYQNRSLK